MQEFKFNYDSENDDLFIYSEKLKSKGAVELGSLVFDFDLNGNLVAIEIMNAIQLLNDLIGKEIVDKKILESIKTCKVSVKIHQNLMLIMIVLIVEHKEVSIPISVPRVVESSPSLNY